MNQSPPPSADGIASRRFILELVGFSPAERELLRSTFRLTGRRSFCYAEATEPDDRIDIYLADADDPAALRELEGRAPNVHAPAVLVGRDAGMGTWPVVGKPIHWMRLFEQLDALMQRALVERARRQPSDENKWDGRTYRRAGDRNAKPVFLPPRPNESVLVVDDSATVRAFMRAKLAPFRFDVDYAENGEAAIDMAQAKSYTCIFLDILMPGMDGYQVCRRLKGSAATKDAAVVMLSSKSSAFDKFRGSWAGCDAYLGKPVAEDELLATIARFLPSARRVASAILENAG